MFSWFLVLLLGFETARRIRLSFFTPTQPPEKTYLRSLTLALLALYFFIIYGSFLYYWLAVSKINVGMSFAGGLIFTAGVLLRDASIKALGSLWSVHVEVKEGHRLVESGPYSRMRHPYSVAVFLELAGFSLLTNAIPFFFLTWMGHLPLLWYRNRHEEKILAHHFGDPYSAFAEKRGAYWPRIFLR